MSRWQKGEATIERLLADGELQQVTGAQADGQPWIPKHAAHAPPRPNSSTRIRTVRTSSPTTPRGSPAWPCSPTKASAPPPGGHYAVDIAVREQFGGPFEQFGALRRQRNELEYPSLATDTLMPSDADTAVAITTKLIDTAERMLPHLGLF